MYDQTIDLTKQLCGISSPSGSEATILEFVAGWLRNHLFENVTQSKDYACGKISGTAGTRQALILCGHIDTVVAGDLSGWQTPPLEITEKDGNLYGLGTTDMKAGLALHMVLAAAQAGAELPFDIWIAAVANEETDGSGAAAFVNWFTANNDYARADCCIAEPTDLRVETGHRGSAFVTFTFSGTPGHASNQAAYPVSGLGLANALLQSLDSLVASTEQFTDPLLGLPSIVPTVFRAGDPNSPNKTSDTAQLTLDIRTTPQFDTALTGWLDDTAHRYESAWQFASAPTTASLCPTDAPVVVAALQASGNTDTTVSNGATDQFSFQAAGINTIVYGPGTFAQAHTQNEYVPLQNIQKALDNYAKMLTVL